MADNDAWLEAERTVLTLSSEAFDEFVRLLDEPPRDCPRLRALLRDAMDLRDG